MKTLRDSFAIGRHVKRDGFACRNEGQSDNPLGSRMMTVNALRGCSPRAGGVAPVRWADVDGEHFRQSVQR